ncbi:hypothetical protein [Moorena sp. SIO3H5]|uniref:hypothetical protein n=1 Tax=Moorena sp. SIO3H5 TaxID=2607834 RepID=UPI0013BAF374|nr:hypothetical protein [Moorena sp. SIO3H5]NEO68206.1 hypothetical protein [Moorena sp. SIO3H5]
MRSEIIDFELYLWKVKVQIRSRIGVNPNLTDFFLGSRESGDREMGRWGDGEMGR